MFEQLTTTARQAAASVSSDVSERATEFGQAANRSATTVAHTVSEQLTQVAGASQQVTARLQSAATKARNVELDLTRFDVAEFTERLPRVGLPKIEFPELPTVDLPRFDAAQLDLGGKLDRVADVTRDIAYAGLGAAVIATQQVDARVRQVAKRTA